MLGAAITERELLRDPAASAAVAAGFAAAAAVCVILNNRLAAPTLAELRFEEEPSDQLLSLNLS